MLLPLLCLLAVSSAVDVDPKGYVVYCPCMGRFGNQMEQALGAFHFAHLLGRTLVLPPIVNHETGSTRAKMIPFEDVFQLKTIQAQYKVITMTEFQRDVMPKVWPAGERKAFCWQARESVYNKEDGGMSCQAKEGNPFGPFWDHVGVDSFQDDIYFGAVTGGYEVSTVADRQKWSENYPASSYPVYAFTGSPGYFPSRPKNWPLQKFFRFNTRITARAKAFIENNLQRPVLGIHLRNERDWEYVCKHVDPERNLFASAQCLGEIVSDVKLTRQICAPSKQEIIDKVVDMVGRTGAKSVFVASDRDHMIDELNEALAAYEVRAERLTPDDPFVSLAILELADEFIGNCVSTFSAFASRSRQYKWKQPKKSHFFGYAKPDSRPKIEL